MPVVVFFVLLVMLNKVACKVVCGVLCVIGPAKAEDTLRVCAK